MKKRWKMLFLLMGVLLLLSGCEKSPVFTLFYTAPYYADDSTIPFYPVATSTVEGGTLLRTDAGDTENLYLWKDGSVTKYKAPIPLYGLTRVGDGYYYWDDEGEVYRYQLETGVSTPVFSLDEGMVPARFWGKDGVLYIVETALLYNPTDYTIYRYDTGTGVLERFDWLSEYGSVDIYFYGVVDDELLVVTQKGQEVTSFWLNMENGARRYDDFSGRICGYRDGSIALYRQDTGEILLHHVQTGVESSIPVPEEVQNDQNGYYQILGVTEENIYWLYRQAICVQKGGKLETAYSFRSVNSSIEPSWQYYQLIDGILYFAYYGEPKEEEWLYDIAPEDPSISENRVVRYAALMPDGTAYILAKEYRENMAA